MTAREKRLRIRLTEKIKRNPEYAERLGVSALNEKHE